VRRNFEMGGRWNGVRWNGGRWNYCVCEKELLDVGGVEYCDG